MFFRFGKRPPSASVFPDAWLPLLHDQVLLYRTLSSAEQVRLRERTAALIAAKHWEGCAGQVITEEVQVTIAGQAAMLLLGLDDYLFDGFHTILVYPGGFLGLQEDELGLPEDVEMHIGEAAHGGPVVLSWWHARWGGRRLGTTNVVLHEFAHKMAELGDTEAGRPPLVDASLRRRWDRIMRDAREQLGEDADYGRPTLFDPYGAESAAEFFAVATETFFQNPREMRRRHGDVYDLLSACYQQDPARRPIPDEVAQTAREAEEEYNRQAVAECTVALQHRPDFLDALRQRADHRLALGDVEGALADWAEVAQRVTDEGDRAEALYERGCILREAGRLDEAVADFSAALHHFPEYAVARADRGAVLAERGDWQGALADLDEAIRLDPRDDTAFVHRAQVYRQQGDLTRALADLKRAVKLSPDDAEILRERAEVYDALGRHDEAQRDRDKADHLEG